MVEHKQLSKAEHEVLIRPNPAMPWRLIKKIYLAFAIFILIIALFLSKFNVYLAIPFYGVEVLFLGYALYITALKSSYFERVTVDKHEIKVEFVNGKKVNQFNFVREWSSFSFKPSTKTQHSEITIAKSGKKIQIAQRINEKDRKVLFNLLKTF